MLHQIYSFSDEPVSLVGIMFFDFWFDLTSSNPTFWKTSLWRLWWIAPSLPGCMTSWQEDHIFFLVGGLCFWDTGGQCAVEDVPVHSGPDGCMRAWWLLPHFGSCCRARSGLSLGCSKYSTVWPMAWWLPMTRWRFNTHYARGCYFYSAYIDNKG